MNFVAYAFIIGVGLAGHWIGGVLAERNQSLPGIARTSISILAVGVGGVVAFGLGLAGMALLAAYHHPDPNPPGLGLPLWAAPVWIGGFLMGARRQRRPVSR